MSDASRLDPVQSDWDIADRDARIEQLLLVGLDHYFAARYDQAINVWTRVLFLDRGHARVRAYIERARSAQAERQRESLELLHHGADAFDRGDTGAARQLLNSAVDRGASQEEALALQGRLDRLDTASGRAQLPADPGLRRSNRKVAGAEPDDRRPRGLAVPLLLLTAAMVVLIAEVTVTTSWDRIRSLGYQIEASTRSGYRLIHSPDLLTPSEVKPLLKTEWMGKVIHYVNALDSTNSKAYELGAQGAEEGEVVIAESQLKGRGRLGRKWFSPTYLTLNLSVILRPPIPPHQASLITLMAAVAPAEAIEKCSSLRPLIKWPNDILLKERKVAGVLNEIQSETDRIHFVMLGIGVNLNMDQKFFPKEIRAIDCLISTHLVVEVG